MFALFMKMILFRFLIVLGVVVNVYTFNQALQVVPGAHNLVCVGLFILQFQKGVTRKLADHVIQHFLAYILVGEMFADAVQLVL